MSDEVHTYWVMPTYLRSSQVAPGLVPVVFKADYDALRAEAEALLRTLALARQHLDAGSYSTARYVIDAALLKALEEPK